MKKSKSIAIENSKFVDKPSSYRVSCLPGLALAEGRFDGFGAGLVDKSYENLEDDPFQPDIDIEGNEVKNDDDNEGGED